jgi:hypothetical protein
MIEALATWGAVVFAIFAAALWYWASMVSVQVPPFDRPFDPRHPNDMVQVSDEGLLITKQFGDKVVDVLATTNAQSRWNSYAALAAAISAAMQAVALIAHRLGM